VAVLVSIKSGHDASYPFRQMRAAEGTVLEPEAGTAGTEYYLSAVGKGGEPAGRWIGEGLADLGIHHGDTIVRADFEALYGEFRDLRDPSGETTLGAPPQANVELKRIYKAKLALEAGATADRRMQLLNEARSEVSSTGVMYWDTTFSPDKTISLAHASALASAMEAQDAGDIQQAAMWSARAKGIEEEVERATLVFIGYMQREARFVRTGHHGRRIDGIEAGRFEAAAEIPVGTFLQHTSRQGDPQLHVHVLWLNKVRSLSDGKWRAVDSRALHRARGAASAVAALSLESRLSERFGFEWISRPKSHGRVIRSVPEKAITAFSSRRTAITEQLALLSAEFERSYGYEPSQYVRWSLRQKANSLTRRGKEEGALDFGQLLREWAETSRAKEAGSLLQLAESMWGGTAAEEAITPDQEHQVMSAALARVQESSATWSRYDLLHNIGECLPDHARTADAVAYLEGLTDRVLAGEAGEVARLDAPEWPRVPDSLRRADGGSIYRPHAAERYATRDQLSMEAGLLADARSQGAPFLIPDVAAKLLGTDERTLEAQLEHLRGQDAQQLTQTGLRLDQAAAAYVVLTSRRTAECVVGPAGTGKGYTAVHMMRAWQAAGMGKVIGLAPSSAAREVLAEAGMETVANLAQFLGHMPGAPGARGARKLGINDLVIVDEASMASMQDMAMALEHVRRCGAKAVIMGDHQQLGAVGSGGGLSMLARKMGFVQLTDAVRFADKWEGGASLDVRAGEVSALGEYDAHGRLHGGQHDAMAEAAVRAYLAEYLTGANVILTAYSNEECFDLNRRVQEYLVSWGQVGTSAPARLLDGAVAYAGDLIIVRKNDNDVETDIVKTATGTRARTLSNGDVLMVDDPGAGSLQVRRLTGQDQQTGERQWSAPFALDFGWVAKHADLGYALSNHAVEGRTVRKGIALVTDTRSRQALYPAMTRGQLGTHVFAYEAETAFLPGADLARAQRLKAARAGVQFTDTEADPLPMLAQVLRRDDEQLSATETRERSLSDADHLALLFAQWDDQVRSMSATRFAAAVLEVLPADQAKTILADTDDLWRSLRGAELAGLDGRRVLCEAVAQRDLTGADNLSSVLTYRVRKVAEREAARVRDTWLAAVPSAADADHERYMAELAAAMDGRQQRIGEHVLLTAPVWATEALGEVPEGEAARAAWQERAGRVGAFREMFGWSDPIRAIGPEPATTSPEMRAEWHGCLALMAKVDGVDVRGRSDGQLLAQRRGYEAETSWAPAFVADRLKLARKAEHTAQVEGSRHHYEALAAERRGDAKAAGTHAELEHSFGALLGRAERERELLAQAHDTRREWEILTEPTRRMARAAHEELLRRRVLEPGTELKSAEPEGFTWPAEETAEVWVQDRLGGGAEPAEPAKELTPAEEEEREMKRLGLTLDWDQEELPQQVLDVAALNRSRQEEIDLRATEMVPEEDHEILGSRAWTGLGARERDAVAQGPVEPVPPAGGVLEAVRRRDAEMEGA
jgi:conjugative relaxase-like TrwC/TraI family protein